MQRQRTLRLTRLQIMVHLNNAAESDALKAGEHAGKLAGAGGSLVSEVVRSMRDIETASVRTTDIDGVIESIAFRTNILALNDTVEASRAGVHEKRFAVVANEVRILAKRSATAAKETKKLIENPSRSITTGAQLVHRTGSNISELVASVRRIGKLFQEFSADSMQHADSLRAVTLAMQSLTEMTRNNTGIAEPSRRSLTCLWHEVQHLAALLNCFQLDAPIEHAAENLLPRRECKGSTALQSTDQTAFGESARSRATTTVVSADIGYYF